MKHQKWLFLIFLACLSFIPSLFLQYIGEEAICTVSSYEMAYHHEYWVPLFYGNPYQRGPFYNWLIISLSHLLSWNHVLISARLITAAATLGSTAMLYRLSVFLFKSRELALWIALIYLSSDASFYHGWIAYSDPLYSFLCFSAVTSLWISILRRSSFEFFLSVIFISAAFLTKAMTGYFYYGTVLMVLFYTQKERRNFILHYPQLLSLILALSVPLIWHWLSSLSGQGAQGMGMIYDMLSKFSTASPDQSSFSVLHYLKILIALPFEWVLKLFPITLLFLWGLTQKRYTGWKTYLGAGAVKWIGLLLLINILPYWLSPQGYEARYLLMLYPFYALLLGIFFYGAKQTDSFFYTVTGLIILKFLLVCIALPLYLHFYRGDYAKTAIMIIKDHPNETLYINADNAVGESVAMPLNLLRSPLPPLTRPPEAQGNYLVIRGVEDAPKSNEKLLKVYPSEDSHSKLNLYRTTPAQSNLD
jgi:4-amino-4-deoxy-L-arabinose transferase-like glycosyltransferase